jgi:hypothetical protein
MATDRCNIIAGQILTDAVLQCSTGRKSEMIVLASARYLAQGFRAGWRRLKSTERQQKGWWPGALAAATACRLLATA